MDSILNRSLYNFSKKVIPKNFQARLLYGGERFIFVDSFVGDNYFRELILSFTTHTYL